MKREVEEDQRWRSANSRYNTTLQSTVIYSTAFLLPLESGSWNSTRPPPSYPYCLFFIIFLYYYMVRFESEISIRCDRKYDRAFHQVAILINKYAEPNMIERYIVQFTRIDGVDWKLFYLLFKDSYEVGTRFSDKPIFTRIEINH